jgi:hypothetical protein
MKVFAIEDSPDRKGYLRVSFSAANEFVFDIRVLDVAGSYEKLIERLCAMAPALLRLDVDLTEAFDDAFRTKPNPDDVQAVKTFWLAYKRNIKEEIGSFEAFFF